MAQLQAELHLLNVVTKSICALMFRDNMDRYQQGLRKALGSARVTKNKPVKSYGFC